MRVRIKERRAKRTCHAARRFVVYIITQGRGHSAKTGESATIHCIQWLLISVFPFMFLTYKVSRGRRVTGASVYDLEGLVPPPSLRLRSRYGSKALGKAAFVSVRHTRNTAADCFNPGRSVYSGSSFVSKPRALQRLITSSGSHLQRLSRTLPGGRPIRSCFQHRTLFDSSSAHVSTRTKNGHLESSRNGCGFNAAPPPSTPFPKVRCMLRVT